MRSSELLASSELLKGRGSFDYRVSLFIGASSSKYLGIT